MFNTDKKFHRTTVSKIRFVFFHIETNCVLLLNSVNLATVKK